MQQFWWFAVYDSLILEATSGGGAAIRPSFFGPYAFDQFLKEKPTKPYIR